MGVREMREMSRIGVWDVDRGPFSHTTNEAEVPDPTGFSNPKPCSTSSFTPVSTRHRLQKIGAMPAHPLFQALQKAQLEPALTFVVMIAFLPGQRRAWECPRVRERERAHQNGDTIFMSLSSSMNDNLERLTSDLWCNHTRLSHPQPMQ